MEVVRSVLLVALTAGAIHGADFALTIGNPMAANVPKVTKSIGLAVRLENCPDLSKATLVATAEGLVEGERKSVPLMVLAGSPAGAYGVNQNWPSMGTWVVNLTATCGSAKAGAIVPFRGAAYVRDAIKSFPRFATASEVELSLKESAGGAR